MINWSFQDQCRRNWTDQDFRCNLVSCCRQIWISWNGYYWEPCLYEEADFEISFVLVWPFRVLVSFYCGGGNRIPGAVEVKSGLRFRSSSRGAGQFCSMDGRSAGLERLICSQITVWFVLGIKHGGSLHAFADVSEYRYGTIIFYHSRYGSLQLVISRGWVSPIKSMTLPWLKLMACLRGCHLLSLVMKTAAEGSHSLHVFVWLNGGSLLDQKRCSDVEARYVYDRVIEI